MKAWLSISACALTFVLCNLSPQQTVLAAGAAVEDSSPTIADLALQDGGVLNGHLISVQGNALANADVAVYQRGQRVATKKTAADGKFQIAGLRPGVYDVVAADTRKQYRAWAPGTAPPNAKLVARFIHPGAPPKVVFPRAYRQRWLSPRGLQPGELLRFGLTAGAIGGTAAAIGYNVSPGS